jgi:hypothetical protein
MSGFKLMTATIGRRTCTSVTPAVRKTARSVARTNSPNLNKGREQEASAPAGITLSPGEAGAIASRALSVVTNASKGNTASA